MPPVFLADFFVDFVDFAAGFAAGLAAFFEDFVTLSAVFLTGFFVLLVALTGALAWVVCLAGFTALVVVFAGGLAAIAVPVNRNADAIIDARIFFKTIHLLELKISATCEGTPRLCI